MVQSWRPSCGRAAAAARSAPAARSRVGVERDVERHDHRVLAALPELRALHAVGEHLLGSQRCGTIEKPMWMK
jgi:hypothetical protein